MGIFDQFSPYFQKAKDFVNEKIKKKPIPLSEKLISNEYPNITEDLKIDLTEISNWPKDKKELLLKNLLPLWNQLIQIAKDANYKKIKVNFFDAINLASKRTSIAVKEVLLIFIQKNYEKFKNNPVFRYITLKKIEYQKIEKTLEPTQQVVEKNQPEINGTNNPQFVDPPKVENKYLSEDEDPREYFELTKIQKICQEINPNIDWSNLYSSYIFYEDQNNILNVSKVYEGRDEYTALSIKNSKDQKVSLLLKNQTERQIYETIKNLENFFRQSNQESILKFFEQIDKYGNISQIEELQNFTKNDNNSNNLYYLEKSVPKIQDYDYSAEITNPINSIQELRERLKTLPFQKRPYTDNMKYDNPSAKFIDTNDILGMSHANSWDDIPESNSKGIKNVWKIVESIQNNTFKNNDPIFGDRIEGKIWITDDGRHRTTAFKALGIKKIPMIIREFTDY